MNRLPKKRGITQDGEDKSLILRHKELVNYFLKVLNSPLETSLAIN
jgi:hypothetical protein